MAETYAWNPVGKKAWRPGFASREEAAQAARAELGPEASFETGAIRQAGPELFKVPADLVLASVHEQARAASIDPMKADWPQAYGDERDELQRDLSQVLARFLRRKKRRPHFRHVVMVQRHASEARRCPDCGAVGGTGSCHGNRSKWA